MEEVRQKKEKSESLEFEKQMDSEILELEAVEEEADITIPIDLGLVSVIVPVYNVEQYLPMCIKSVLHQTYPHFELLLVDDGSKDGSGSICDEYAAMDDRIRVIHKENEGASATRNRGLEEAVGNYILFVDSDDYISRHTLRRMITTITRYQTDLVICGYERFREGWHQKYRLSPYSLTILQSKLELASLFKKPQTNLMGISIWAKLYRADLIRDHNIRFCEDIHYEEDCLFNLDYYRTINTTAVIRDYCYFYRQMDVSLSKGYRKNTFRYLIEGYRGRRDFYMELGLKTNALLGILMIAIKNTIVKIFNSDLPIKEKLSEYAEIIQYSESQDAFEMAVRSKVRLTRYLAKAGIQQNPKCIHGIMNMWNVYTKIKSIVKRSGYKVKKAAKAILKR